MILELAENANTYTPLTPGQERIVDPAGRYVVWIGEEPYAGACVAQRFRFAEDDVERGTEEIRGLLRDRGRPASTWEVAASATPPDLADRLLALGMTVDEPLVVGMALRGPPAQDPPADVVSRRVATLDELVRATRIQHEAFGLASDVDGDLAARRFAGEGTSGATYVALLDGEVVAAAYGSFTPHGVLLFGGATAPAARGRGAYRAQCRRGTRTPSPAGRRRSSRTPLRSRARSWAASASRRCRH